MAVWKERFKAALLASVLVLAGGVVVSPGGARAQSPARAQGFTHSAYNEDPRLRALSEEYSRKAVAQDPYLGKVLDGLGLQHLNQLDPRKVYTLNKATGAVTAENVSSAIEIPIGFLTGSFSIKAVGSDIVGRAQAIDTCPLAAQTASVSGFMASTVSRDPVAGIRNGTIVSDDFLSTVAQVDFRILKAAGGARNPVNRTVLEATISGTCGTDVQVKSHVTTWPPLRVDMAVDDTGSMSEQLSGVKAALTNFIDTRNVDPDHASRDTSYELISFKDSPTLRLANTEDGAAAKSAVNALFPAGGGDCPEDALGAVGLALDRLATDEDSAGAIVLVTDASPRGGDVDALIAHARSLGVPVHVMLSGDCGETTSATALSITAALPARQLYEKLATGTGGSYFFLPGGTAEDYTRVLNTIFETVAGGGGSDVEPPTVSVRATPTTIWPANHKMVRISTTVTATDNQDPKPKISLVGVTSNEPDNAQGDGNTEQDIQITGDGAISVRAERNGGGNGRIYTITYQAMDASGNVGFGTVQVLVPHDKP